MGTKKMVVDLAIPIPDAGRPKGNLRKLYGTKIAEEEDRQAREGLGKKTNGTMRVKEQ